jgi:hypothetical protein
MNIHPLWFVCITVRSVLAIIVWNLQQKKTIDTGLDINNIMTLLLLLIAIGFVYKSVTGSNNETQLAPVFWHSTRFVHAILFTSAFIALFMGRPKISSLLIASDVLFSIIYRVTTDQ